MRRTNHTLSQGDARSGWRCAATGSTRAAVLATFAATIMVFAPLSTLSAEEAVQAPTAETESAVVEDSSDDLFTRKLIVGGAVGSMYVGAGLFTYFAWYKNQTISDEFLWRDEGWFGGNTYAGGADKLGHMYSNYIMARGTSQLLQYGGFKPLSASLAANALTLSFFIGIELKDAYHARFGFSSGDMVANVTGNVLATLMETVPVVDRYLSLRFEYTPSADYVELVRRTGTIDAAEDYSGQRFLLAYHLAAVEGVQEGGDWVRWMRFFDVTTGYYTRNYLPEPLEPDQKLRRLFLGVSINVQQLLDEYAFGYKRRGPLYGTTHFATEVLAVPFTTYDAVGVQSLTSPVHTIGFD